LEVKIASYLSSSTCAFVFQKPVQKRYSFGRGGSAPALQPGPGFAARSAWSGWMHRSLVFVVTDSAGDYMGWRCLSKGRVWRFGVSAFRYFAALLILDSPRSKLRAYCSIQAGSLVLVLVLVNGPKSEEDSSAAFLNHALKPAGPRLSERSDLELRHAFFSAERPDLSDAPRLGEPRAGVGRLASTDKNTGRDAR